jgi:glycosyltransferase involved in cell wall biosynthesis
LKSLYEHLEGTGKSFEVVLVDDGSTDDSLMAAEGLVKEHPACTLVSLRRNRGKSAALAVGIEYASGAVIITVDADLQDDPTDIPKFLERLDDGLDLVCGWRRPRRDSLYKRLQSRMYNLALKVAGFRVVHDINCGFKAMRSEVAREIPLYGERHRLIPLIASWQGFRVGEIVVNHRPRRQGKSKYGASRFPNAIFDILTALLLSRFYKRPSHLFSSVGSVLALAGLVICGYITYLKISTGTIQYRYPLLVLGVVLLAIGVQLVLTGFLSELIVHTRSRPSPEYSIKKLARSPETTNRSSAGK